MAALDTSTRFVAECKKNCQKHPNVQVLKLGDDYIDLSLIPEKFSLMICASVIQYYKDLEEIVALIQSASAQALPSAVLLITDIPMKRNFFQLLNDIFDSIILGFRNGYLGTLFKATLTCLPEIFRYQKVSKKIRNQEFSYQDLESIIQKSGCQGTILSNPLSIHAKRPGLLIELKGASA